MDEIIGESKGPGDGREDAIFSVLRPISTVAGHGGMVGDEIVLLKPLLDGPRGLRELEFYRWAVNSEWSGSLVPRALCIAEIGDLCEDGCVLVRENGIDCNVEDWGPWRRVDVGGEVRSGLYVVLEDLRHGFVRPSVADIKVGITTWGPDASEAKVRRESGKYPPAHVLGFRWCGLRVWEDDLGRWSCESRSFGLELTESTSGRGLLRLLKRKGGVFARDLASDLAVQVRRMADEVERGPWHLHGTSVLIIVESCGTVPARGRVRLIDFANAVSIEEAERQKSKGMTVPDGKREAVGGMRNLAKLLQHAANSGEIGCSDIPPSFYIAPL